MNTEMNIADLVCRLSDLKLELTETQLQAQEPLRDYVTNTSFPIDDRFEVWSEWCDKRDHGCVIHEADVPLIGKMVDDCEPNDYERYADYSWEHFLAAFTDKYDGDKMRERYGVTVDDVKELLIRENFGSYTHDW
jgi:hypothetical protein